jgi:hypothetical protein
LLELGRARTYDGIGGRDRIFSHRGNLPLM